MMLKVTEPQDDKNHLVNVAAAAAAAAASIADNERKLKEVNQFRLVAFLSIAFSTVTLVLCIVSVPWIYSHIQVVQSELDVEMLYCKFRSHDLWNEVGQLINAKGEEVSSRRRTRDVKGVWYYGRYEKPAMAQHANPQQSIIGGGMPFVGGCGGAVPCGPVETVHKFVRPDGGSQTCEHTVKNFKYMYGSVKKQIHSSQFASHPVTRFPLY
ncbi:unnamed protein product [Soboliphyme baturini]|uniref:Col_cuticle_N domain-containing protein n=1 Tax=Soboliphyme baturini TaxID=241478 RepID=A0A183JB65_9BILA|nr:unnamed protein product [Soboliphyme baturini]